MNTKLTLVVAAVALLLAAFLSWKNMHDDEVSHKAPLAQQNSQNSTRPIPQKVEREKIDTDNGWEAREITGIQTAVDTTPNEAK